MFIDSREGGRGEEGEKEKMDQGPAGDRNPPPFVFRDSAPTYLPHQGSMMSIFTLEKQSGVFL